MKRLSFILTLCALLGAGTLHAQQGAPANAEGGNRNMLLNASSASQPRQISLGLPTGGNAYIFEDGLPVSYYNYQIYPYRSWHSGVSHESTRTMSPQDMVLKYGIISYSVDSKSRLAGDRFEGRINYTLNQFGRQALDVNIATPLGRGWGMTVGSYQDFDPGSNHMAMSWLHDRIQFYKGTLSKTFAGGRGKAGLIYQYSRYLNHMENYGPFIFVGDGSVKELDGFRLGYDSYRPADRYIEYLDVVTGRMTRVQVDESSTDRIRNLNFVLDYRFPNGMELSVHSKYKNGHSFRNFPRIAGVTDAVAEDGFTYADGTPYIGLVQNRRHMHVDGFERSFMNNVGLSGQSVRHRWRAEADWWLNRGGVENSMWMLSHEVKKDPALLRLNGRPGYAYNSDAEYYKGHESKLFAFASDEWSVSERLWLYGGLRLEYLHIGGHAANDVHPGNARHDGFSLIDPGVELTPFDNKYFNYAYIGSGRLALFGGFGLQAEFSHTMIHSQIFHYGTYRSPSLRPITASYFRGGIYWKNSWIDMTSQISWITQTNSQERPAFSHVLTKDVGEYKAGHEELVTVPVYYDLGALSWVTDAVLTPVKGLSIHVMFTARKPQYRNFKVTPTFSDGVTEEHDFSGNIITAQSRTELEFEPSYSFGRWRIWLSARHYSRQFINKTNTLYFNGRWETFGGADFKLNDRVTFAANLINLLNQKGASGSIGSADLVTDPTPYQNYIMAGTFIRPFTFEFTTRINF